MYITSEMSGHVTRNGTQDDINFPTTSSVA